MSFELRGVDLHVDLHTMGSCSTGSDLGYSIGRLPQQTTAATPRLEER
jgi:hypothetical protein